MADPRVEKLAQILVDHSAEIKPGDRVAIEATTAAQPLVRALYATILERGGYPHLLLELPDQDEILFAHAKDEQLDAIPTFRKLAYDQFESRIRIHSATNPRCPFGRGPGQAAPAAEGHRLHPGDPDAARRRPLLQVGHHALSHRRLCHRSRNEPERFRRLRLPRLPRRPGRPGGILE